MKIHPSSDKETTMAFGSVKSEDLRSALATQKKQYEAQLAQMKGNFDRQLQDLRATISNQRSESIRLQVGFGETISLRQLIDEVITDLKTVHPELFQRQESRSAVDRYSSVTGEVIDETYNDVDTDTVEELVAGKLLERVRSDIDLHELVATLADKILENEYLDLNDLTTQIADKVQVSITIGNDNK